MEENNKNKYTPATIGDMVFSIPLYQRLFSWKKDNVEKLLYDLKEHFEKTSGKPYYLGMLTCVEQRDKKNLLIDGQQRMTVMMLMAIVFKNYEKQSSIDEEPPTGWQKFLKNGDRIEFTARSDDEEYIKGKIEGHVDENSNEYVNHNMEQALNAIDSFLEKNYENNVGKVNEFIKNVYNHLTFFITELPPNYEKDTTLLNKYFEAMNSQGRGLEQHEILKVELLKGLPKESDEDILTNIWNIVSQMDRPLIKDEKTNMDEYRQQYVRAIRAIRESKGIKDWSEKFRNNEYLKILLGDNNEKGKEDSPYTIKNLEANKKDFKSTYRDEGTDSIISFEEFLLLVLDICKKICNDDKSQEEKTEDSINHNGDESTTKSSISSYSFYQTDKLLERFQPLLNSSTGEIKDFYWALLYYRLLMDYYVIRREFRNGEGNYTLLMKGDDNEEEKSDANQSDSYSKKMRQYQSMLYVSTPFYRWLKPFLVELATGNIAGEPEKMLKWLKDEDNERHKKEEITEQELIYGKIDRYWFWRLDYYLWETRDDWCKDEYAKYKDAVSKYVFRSNRSIEHFHPQDEHRNTSWNRDIVDSFGNLAMISQSFNSQQSNDHLKIKFDRIYEQLDNKALQSIKLLRMCMHVKFDYSQWKETEAKNHGEEMIKVLENSFPQDTNNNGSTE